MDALDICYASAGELAPLVKNKEVSPVEIIDAHLARIEATEPVLNSFITLLADTISTSVPVWGCLLASRPAS